MKWFLLQEKNGALELIALSKIIFPLQVQLWFCFSVKRNRKRLHWNVRPLPFASNPPTPSGSSNATVWRGKCSKTLWIPCFIPMLISVSFATIGYKLQLLLENLSLAIRHKDIWLIYQFTWYSELTLLSLTQPKRHQKKILNPRWLLSCILKPFILFSSAAESLCT